MIDLIELLKSGVLGSQHIMPDYSLNKSNGAVALILRESKDSITKSQELRIRHPHQSKIFTKCYELLFLRRTPHQNDYYSGQLCFPGGGRQQKEQPYATAVRQVQQQIGIVLKPDQLITAINRVFVAYSPKKHTLAAAFIFLVDNEIQINMDQRQICQFKWLPLDYFLSINPNENCFESSNNSQYLFTEYLNLMQVSQQKAKQFVKNYECMNYPCFDIGMGMVLWGFTLYVLTYIFYKLYTHFKNLQTQIRRKQHENMLKVDQKDNEWLQKLQILIKQATGWTIFCLKSYSQKKQADNIFTDHARYLLKVYIQIYPKL